MKLNLINTSEGLKPCYDDDYDEKKKLRLGEVYAADIKPARNLRFHRLYFALINLAWEYLPESQTAGFRSKENFRKYVEIAAGCCDVIYHPRFRDWVEVPRSISFDRMDEAEFRDVYDRVRDVIFSIIGRFVTREEFERNLSNF